MRFATTEIGLQLNNRVAASTSETPRNRYEQIAHTLGDEGSTKELLCILIFLLGVARSHT